MGYHVAMNQASSCPICKGPVRFSERYPKQVCPQCAARAQDGHGRPLKFRNTHLSGGFEANYADGECETYPSHMCTIDGVECKADEAHLGGIVIEMVNP